METIAAPWQQMEGQEVHGRYPLQKCLAEGERQAVFETVYREKPAIIKLIRPDTSQTAFRLLAGIDAGKSIHHPNLVEIYDSGDIRMGGVRYVYAVMERADENLGRVLRDRPLEPDELRELLNGAMSALEFLHAESLIHTGLKPSNVLAVGDLLKLSSDGLHPASVPRGFAQAPGIYDAPETGSGTYLPASDVYSLAVLLREAATGVVTESSMDRIPAPFDAIVRGGLIRDPQQRWTTAKIASALRGDPVPLEVAPKQPVSFEKKLEKKLERKLDTKRESGSQSQDAEDTVPVYRKYGKAAIAGALAAGLICALVVRSASHSTPAPAPVVAVPQAANLPADPAPQAPAAAAPVHRKTWAVVAATYHKEADAEKRAHALRKHHNSLHPQVVSTGESRFLVVFGKGLSEPQARAMEQRAKKSGAARDAFVTQLE